MYYHNGFFSKYKKKLSAILLSFHIETCSIRRNQPTIYKIYLEKYKNNNIFLKKMSLLDFKVYIRKKAFFVILHVTECIPNYVLECHMLL